MLPTRDACRDVRPRKKLSVMIASLLLLFFEIPEMLCYEYVTDYFEVPVSIRIFCNAYCFGIAYKVKKNTNLLLTVRPFQFCCKHNIQDKVPL